MRIAAAVAADLPALHALIESAYRGDSARRGWTHEADLLGGQRIDVEQLQELLADPAESLLLAWEDGTLIGSVRLRRESATRAYIGLLAVDPTRQGGGVGSVLLAAAETLARDVGSAMVRMTVLTHRSELIAYYGRRGYRDTGEREPFPDDPRFGEPNRPDLCFAILEKPLS